MDMNAEFTRQQPMPSQWRSYQPFTESTVTEDTARYFDHRDAGHPDKDESIDLLGEPRDSINELKASLDRASRPVGSQIPRNEYRGILSHRDRAHFVSSPLPQTKLTNTTTTSNLKHDSQMKTQQPNTSVKVRPRKKVRIAPLPAVKEDSDEEELDEGRDNDGYSLLGEVWPEMMEDGMKLLLHKREVFVLGVFWCLYLCWIFGLFTGMQSDPKA